MTTTEPPARVTTRPTSRTAWAQAGLALLAVVVVVLVACLDRVTVTTHFDHGRLGFGRPFDALSQNQSATDPPLPAVHRFLSPWEFPVSIRFVGFLADLALAYLALLAIWLLGRRVVRGSGLTRRAGRDRRGS